MRYAPANQGLIFDSVHMAIEAALGGQGVAIGLQPLVDDDIKAHRLFRLFALELNSPFSFWFVCRRNRIKDARIAQFREWLHAEIRAAN